MTLNQSFVAKVKIIEELQLLHQSRSIEVKLLDDSELDLVGTLSLCQNSILFASRSADLT